jgi:hypothetical protein
LWLAGGGRGGSVPTYVLGTFYIRFFGYVPGLRKSEKL